MTVRTPWRRDLSAQAVATGTSATVLGYSGAIAVVVAGLSAVGADAGQVGSALVAMGLLIAASSVALSWALRLPVAVVWTTPGAALLVGVGELDGGFGAAVGAFVVAAGLVVLTGAVRPLTALVARIPAPLAAAVLAGVLLPFCLRVVPAVAELPLQAGAIAVVWLVAVRWVPSWTAPAALLALAAVVLVSGSLPPVGGALPRLEWVAPVVTLDGVLRLAVPLYLVTMAAQNLVGLAVLRTEGYDPPAGTLLASTGVAAAAAAPFGGFMLNLSAITGALVAGPSAHPDPARRWVATAASGLAFLPLAAAGPLVAAVVTGVDPRLVAAAAGLALVPALAAAAAGAVADEGTRLAAAVALLVSASGVPGAPAAGLAVGLVVLRLQRTGPQRVRRRVRRR